MPENNRGTPVGGNRFAGVMGDAPEGVILSAGDERNLAVKEAEMRFLILRMKFIRGKS